MGHFSRFGTVYSELMLSTLSLNQETNKYKNIQQIKQ